MCDIFRIKIFQKIPMVLSVITVKVSIVRRPFNLLCLVCLLSIFIPSRCVPGFV